MTNRVKIIDATLREGAQARGVRWTPASSAEVAVALAAAGVETIECGHPAVGPSERERIRAVIDRRLAVPVLVHARALEKDVDAALETGAPWVGLFLGVNEISRRARVPGDIPSLLALLSAAVGHAKASGLRVRFTLEDATRTEEPDALAAFGAAVEQGADRICVADTVGVAEPHQVAEHVARIRRAFDGIDIEVHLHDDRGLAMANALAAVDAGATWVSTAVNGLGERCGIPDLATLTANMAYRGLRDWTPGEALQRLSRLVAEHAGWPPDVRRPVVGAHAFTHVAKLHVTAMARDPASYSWVEPERLGRRPESVTRDDSEAT